MSDKGPVPAGAGAALEPRLGGVLGTGALGALLLGAAGVAPALAPLSLFSALPLAVLRVRRGAASAFLATVLAAALVASAGAPAPALSYLVVLAPPVLLLGESLARGRGLLRGCGCAFALLAIEIAVALTFAGGAVTQGTLGALDQSIEEFVTALRASGVAQDALAQLTDQLKSAREVVAVVLPALAVIGAALFVITNAALLRLYLLRRDPGWLEEGEFERVRFPLGLVAVFIVSGAAVALPAARTVAYNVLLVAAFFFALQGLAVVAFYARRLAAPPVLRLALLLLVLANPWAAYILALLGLFDNWIAFRRWAEPPPPAPR